MCFLYDCHIGSNVEAGKSPFSGMEDEEEAIFRKILLEEPKIPRNLSEQSRRILQVKTITALC
jgi:hypothetical protein